MNAKIVEHTTLFQAFIRQHMPVMNKVNLKDFNLVMLLLQSANKSIL